MRVAVTSSDGNLINLHFGKAERFLIYEIGNEEPTYIGQVAASPYCGWAAMLKHASAEGFEAIIEDMRACAEEPPVHQMMPEKLAAIASALAGCRLIVTAMIGDAPREEMERRGFDIYTMSGQIEPSLKELSKLY